MLDIDNVSSIEELLNCCCLENEHDGCMLNGCNHCEATYLHKQGVTVKVRGRWYEQETYDCDIVYECSVCGEQWSLDAGTPKENNMNFCPNCGASMMEDKENE